MLELDKIYNEDCLVGMKRIEVIIIRYGTQICSVKTKEQKYRNSIVDGAKRIAMDYAPCLIEISVNGKIEERFYIDENEK